MTLSPLDTTRPLHRCTICGRIGPWTDSWSWFGSYKEFEDGRPIIKACSDAEMHSLDAPGLSRVLVLLGRDPDYVVDPGLATP